MRNYLAPTPLLRYNYFSTIRSNIILFYRDNRRIVLIIVIPRITYILIDWISIPIQLPHSRHRHLPPIIIIVSHLIKIRRTQFGVCHPIKTPRTIEGQDIARCPNVTIQSGSTILVRKIRRMHWGSINAVNIGVKPWFRLCR